MIVDFSLGQLTINKTDVSELEVPPVTIDYYWEIELDGIIEILDSFTISYTDEC